MKFILRFIYIIPIIMCMGSFATGVANPEITSIASYTNLKWFTFIAFATYAVVRTGLKYLSAAGPVPIAFMVFLVIATISTLTQYTDLEEAAKRVVSFWLLYLISFVAAIPLDPGQRLRAWTLAAVVVSGLVVAASLVLIPSEAAFVQGRLCGVTNNANTLGTFSAMLFAAGFGFVCSQGGPFRLARWLTPTAAGLTLMLSHSRAATIAAAAGVITVLAATRRWLAAALFAATATGYLMSPIVLEVLLPNDVTILKDAESAAHRDTLNLSTRQDVWNLQVQTWLESPLVGHGLEIHQEEGCGADRRRGLLHGSAGGRRRPGGDACVSRNRVGDRYPVSMGRA